MTGVLRRKPAEEELAATWAALGVNPDDSSFRGDTLVNSRAPTSPAGLPSLLSASAVGAAELELGEVLGEGGMGIVHTAKQTALQRQVAVKTSHPGSDDDQVALQLLREGRITGALEHPNIVPVYALGQDGNGRPLIVMKRIEGTRWTSLIDEVPLEERLSGLFMRKHLHILQQVAAAVHFAHSRGVIHRDVKPDNVMIGNFGEVYLVDWGIAVATGKPSLSGVTLASSVCGIEGTPAYMAPEMAIGAGDELGVWSDVYLLGAALHHVITGEPPHGTKRLHEVLLSAFASTPAQYDPSVPAELVAIAHKAMDRATDVRYPTAAAFSDALEEFLLHRGALELCDEAERRFDELISMGRADHERAESLFNEARFAFEQSLRSWPKNDRARVGRGKLIEAMTQFELARDAPRLAEALLRLHDEPPPGLLEEVRTALHSDQVKHQRLAALEHDVDPGFGAQERVYRIYLGAAGWLAICVVCGVVTKTGLYDIQHLEFALLISTMLLGSLISMFRARKTMLANAANRRVAYTSSLVFGFGVMLWPLMGSFGASMPATTMLSALIAAALWSTVGIQGDRSWLPMPIGHLIVALGTWLVPSYHFEIYGLSAAGAVLTAVLTQRDIKAAQSKRPVSDT